MNKRRRSENQFAVQYVVSTMYLLHLYILPLTIVSSKTLLRSVGGRNALPAEFPFVVRFDVDRGSYMDFFCTGSALTRTWVLTAAHCVEDINDTNRGAFAVRYNIFFPNKMGDTSDIIDTKIKEHYGEYFNHDIALVRTTPMNVDGLAKLSSLDYTSTVGMRAFGVGYGVTNATGSPPPLQVLEGMLALCKGAYASARDDFLPAICLTTKCNVEASLLPGDSGGPIVHESGIVAITSRVANEYDELRRELLIQPREVSVYGNIISPYLDWIAQVVKEND